MKILILDNYDSFTYNLVQYVRELTGEDIDVYRNDEISLDAVAQYDTIILSPGPGVPKDAGIMPALLQQYASTKSIFGVCLGHQAIGEAFGAELLNLKEVYHGVPTPMMQTDVEEPLFAHVPQTFEAGRYHSWVVRKESLPAALIVTAVDDQGEIMAMRHREYDVVGVQFHPESIMTPYGKQMLANFLKVDYLAGEQPLASEIEL
ncbi:MAG: aminodeoxychorismate/anthranilate synthase component II [Bacteroidota bacterium]